MVRVLANPAELAQAAAEEFTRAAQATSGAFRVALSGGSTPKTLYALLADPARPYRARLPWPRLHFFWGDERCVPAGHEQRNDRMAREALLSPAGVPEAHIHPIAAELPDHDEAARRYEGVLRAELGSAVRFDWIFLGLGTDGHTASLFPGTPVLAEKDKLVSAVWVEKLKSHRITLTMPVINAAARVAFLVAGQDKTDMVRRILHEPPQDSVPASRVGPANGELSWFLDAAAV